MNNPTGFTIRQIVLTHIPRMDMLCFGCLERWNPEHVVAVLEQAGFNTNEASRG